MNIVYCSGTYGDRIWQTKLCLERMAPHVDRCVIIVDETVTKEQIKEMEAVHQNVECHFHKWNDDFPEMRNHYLEKLDDNDWCIVSDPDELFNEAFVEKIEDIVDKCEIESIGVIFVASYDIFINPDGSETIPDYENIPPEKRYYKQLMFKYSEGMKYEGVGETKNVHEMIPQPIGFGQTRIPIKYFYTHTKYFWEVWERAFRNVFISGGGNNVGERNAQWKPLREIFSGLGIDNITNAREYMRKGNVDQNIKNWLIENRRDGWDFEHEMMECFRWYFEYLHPEENIDGLKILDKVDEDSPEGIMRYIEQKYLELLGRHADQAGKEAYTQAIISGKMHKNELEQLLIGSEEYQSKVGGDVTDVEVIPIQFPVTVNVGIPPELIMEALKQSSTYKDIIEYVEWARKYITFNTVHVAMANHTSTTTAINDEMIRLFEKEFSDKESLLDVGSSNGYCLQQLLEKGYNVVGVHPQKSTVSQARCSDIPLALVDLHNTKLPRNFYDFVFCSDIMPFIFSPWIFILELRKTIMDGGIIMIHLENYTKEPFLKNILYNCPLTIRAMRNLFIRAGFKEIKIKSDEKIYAFEKIQLNKCETETYIKLLTW
jgi:SAM-dependent methyltransferase